MCELYLTSVESKNEKIVQQMKNEGNMGLEITPGLKLRMTPVNFPIDGYIFQKLYHITSDWL